MWLQVSYRILFQGQSRTVETLSFRAQDVTTGLDAFPATYKLLNRRRSVCLMLPAAARWPGQPGDGWIGVRAVTPRPLRNGAHLGESPRVCFSLCWITLDLAQGGCLA